MPERQPRTHHMTSQGVNRINMSELETSFGDDSDKCWYHSYDCVYYSEYYYMFCTDNYGGLWENIDNDIDQ